MKPYDLPDARGHFGPYGGSFVSETLVAALEQLNHAYDHYSRDPEFIAEFNSELKHFVGRPSPIYHAKRWSEILGGAQIYLKREDLNHTGAHKINNTIGQALLARRMGKQRVIAETGAGQHGVASATVAARFGMKCVVYMGAEDVGRQSANVYRMKLLGAEVVPVESGSRTLKDALNEAMRDWVTNVEDTFYIIGTVAGPHPYPMMVRDFQRVIGMEARAQIIERTGGLPDAVVACIGDAPATEICYQAGVGAAVELSLGGKLDPVASQPLAVKGQVKFLLATDDLGLLAHAHLGLVQVAQRDLLGLGRGERPGRQPGHRLRHLDDGQGQQRDQWQRPDPEHPAPADAWQQPLHGQGGRQHAQRAGHQHPGVGLQLGRRGKVVAKAGERRHQAGADTHADDHTRRQQASESGGP